MDYQPNMQLLLGGTIFQKDSTTLQIEATEIHAVVVSCYSSNRKNKNTVIQSTIVVLGVKPSPTTPKKPCYQRHIWEIQEFGLGAATGI